MLINPEDYIPVEVALRTTRAQQTFRAQPRRTRRVRRFGRSRRQHTLAA